MSKSALSHAKANTKAYFNIKNKSKRWEGYDFMDTLYKLLSLKPRLF